jgi:hypothetical protein
VPFAEENLAGWLAVANRLVETELGDGGLAPPGGVPATVSDAGPDSEAAPDASDDRRDAADVADAALAKEDAPARLPRDPIDAGARDPGDEDGADGPGHADRAAGGCSYVASPIAPAASLSTTALLAVVCAWRARRRRPAPSARN